MNQVFKDIPGWIQDTTQQITLAHPSLTNRRFCLFNTLIMDLQSHEIQETPIKSRKCFFISFGFSVVGICILCDCISVQVHNDIKIFDHEISDFWSNYSILAITIHKSTLPLNPDENQPQTTKSNSLLLCIWLVLKATLHYKVASLVNNVAKKRKDIASHRPPSKHLQVKMESEGLQS